MAMRLVKSVAVSKSCGLPFLILLERACPISLSLLKAALSLEAKKRSDRGISLSVLLRKLNVLIPGTS